MLIYHRGNNYGTMVENNPELLPLSNLMKNKLEIDLWKLNDKFYLGHDGPQYNVEQEWIQYWNPKLFLHAKNVEALLYIKQLKYSWGFWHQNDDYALTWPDCKIIVYPGKALVKDAIVMKPELYPYDLLVESKPYAVCTDFPENFMEFA